MQIKKSLLRTHIIVFDDELNTFIFEIDGDKLSDDPIARNYFDSDKYTTIKLAAEKFLNDENQG